MIPFVVIVYGVLVLVVPCRNPRAAGQILAGEVGMTNLYGFAVATAGFKVNEKVLGW
jgi:hypothetical protein